MCPSAPEEALRRALAQAAAGRLAPAVRELSDLLQRLPPGELRERATLELAEARARKGDLVEAGLALRELELASAQSQRTRGRVDLVRGYVLYRTGSVAEAKSAYRDALRAAAADDLELLADSLAGLGHVLVRESGGSRKGDRLLRRAEQLHRQSGNGAKLSRTLSRQASSAIRSGDMARGVELNLLALETAVAAGDLGGAAECHIDLGSVLFDCGELERAERHLREALSGFEELGDGRSLTLARANLAAVAVELGRPEQAESILSESLRRDREAGARIQEAHDLRLWGIAAAVMGREEQARERLAQARELFLALDDHAGEAETLLALSDLELRRADAASALSLAEAGLRRLAPVAHGAWVQRLRLVAARAHLEARGVEGAARRVANAVAAGRASTDPSVRAEAELLLGIQASLGRDQVEARARFRQALELAHAQERPAVRQLVIDTVRRYGHVPPIAQSGEVTRIETQALEQDGITRVEAILEAGASASTLSSLLELFRQRVPCLAAFLFLPDSAGPVESDAPPTSSVVAFAEGARLTGQVRITTLASLGGALAVPSPRGFVLYAERVAGQQFRDAEVLFARGLVARLDREEPRSSAREDRPVPDDDLGILGRSALLAGVREALRRIAGFDLPVFIHGESGTGKELVAKAIHRLSVRGRRPFVAVNCAAIPDSLFEAELFGHVRGAFTGADSAREGLFGRAEGGILLLDEIGELSPLAQAKLLRVVEEREYRPVGSAGARRSDVRILSATNRDVEDLVRSGALREDLYYRLMATARIDLPPLRERKDDIPLLFSHFAGREALCHGVAPLLLTPEALARLEAYAYPGNVRELERLVAGLYVRCLGPRVAQADLPAMVRGEDRPVRGAETLREARLGFERRYLEDLLRRHGGNRTRAAKSAGVARQSLVALLKRHGPVFGDVKIEKAPGPRAGRERGAGLVNPDEA